MSDHKKITHLALTGLLALTATSLTGCSNHSAPVACKGVIKQDPNQAVIMPKGECIKLDGGITHPASDFQIKHYAPQPYGTFVKCYGVAAANKNDCGTKTTACAGTEKQARASDAWIALPKATCVKVGGKVVEPTKQGEWHPMNAIKKEIL